MTSRHQQPQEHTVSELQMMLTQDGNGVPSSGAMANHPSVMANHSGVMANHPSPMGTITSHSLPPHQTFYSTIDAFAHDVHAASEKVGVGRITNTSDSVMSSTSNEQMMVNTMPPLPLPANNQFNSESVDVAIPALSPFPLPVKNDDVGGLPPPSSSDPEIIMKRLQALMERTQMSQKRLQVSTIIILNCCPETICIIFIFLLPSLRTTYHITEMGPQEWIAQVSFPNDGQFK